MAEPRILVLSPEHPDPEGNGGEVRLFHVLRELGRRGRDVVVIAPATAEKLARGATLAADGIDVRSVRRPADPTREATEALLSSADVGRALFTRSWLSWQAEVYRRELRARLQEAWRERWDAVVIEHDWAVGWARLVPERIPVGLVFHNLTGDLLRREAAQASGRVRRARVRRDARLTDREIARHASRLTRAFACSAEDAREVTARWGVDADVVPNGTDVGRHAGIGHGKELPGRIVFTGTMSYAPNAQAAGWLVREVLPLVRARRPDATLQLVGGAPTADVLALGAVPGVEVTGRVPELAPHLAAAEVAVAPLLSGGGTKLKVLEALAAGRPLVATTTGAEGIEVEDGVHLRIADPPDAFAGAVVSLLDDRAAARDLGERGRVRIAERYDWSSIGARMDAGLRDWLGA